MLLSILVIIWASIFLIPLTYCTKRVSGSRNLIYCWSLLQLLSSSQITLTVILLFIFVWLLTVEPILCHPSYHWGHLQQHSQVYLAPIPLLLHSHPSPHCSSAQYTRLSRIKICITPILCPILFFCSCPHCVSELQHSSLYTPTGYNALFGKDHIKYYYSHDGICASVIRHLRLMALWMTQLSMTWFM